MKTLEAGEPLERAVTWRKDGAGVALATVIATWGSSPRPSGSQLVVKQDGEFEGSVSGGCVEGAVIESAQQVIATGAPADLKFGVTDEQAWEVGLACGGQVRIFVERIEVAEPLQTLIDARAERRELVRVLDLQDAKARLVARDGANLEEGLREAVAESCRSDRAAVADLGEHSYFVQPFLPDPRLVIVGAVHIAQVLAPIARQLGYEVTVVDPRSAFATQARFPETRFVCSWPDEALPELSLDAHTALVTLTHDVKLDDPALQLGLRAEPFYIGALGSRRNHERRLERLREAGFSETDLARIHGPVGLDLGARSPAEIALSIMAQIVSRMRSGSV